MRGSLVEIINFKQSFTFSAKIDLTSSTATYATHNYFCGAQI